MRKNGFAPVILLILVAAILVIGYLFVKSDIKDLIVSKITSPANLPSATVAPAQAPLFTGKLTRLSQDLALFKETEDMKLNGRFGGFAYYSAGQFIKGNLDGYTRVVATAPQNGPDNPLIYVLATKDFKTYILDDPNDATTKYPEDDYQNPYSNLDKTKIVSTATFDTEQPQSISLNGNFSLFFDSFFTTQVESSFKDKFNQSISETVIQTGFSSFQKLTSPDKNLTIYFQNNKNPVNKYVLGDTKVIAVDSTGLPAVYSVTTPQDVSTYKIKKQQYDIDYQKYSNKETTNFPNYVSSPHLGFSGSDISNSFGLNFYKDYEKSFPGACAFDLDTNVVKVSDGDLEEIGTVKKIPVFRLKNQNSELSLLQYDSKMSYYKDAGLGMTFKDANPGISEPASLSDYTKNNPLLFIKDYWGRWVAFGEWDIQLPGGCGKPVIYLYPQKDTKVTLKFNAPVSFITDIPTYGGYWEVLAHKDGSLINLRPNLTDCSKINFSEMGNEYAKEACRTNNYPYLYWSGNIMSVNYPMIDSGWVVGKENLKDFIDSKLNYMGLNVKEKQDFEAYWIPEMLGKNTPYYRVSFITTGQLNKLFPMTITPVPDSIFRIFMDWQPLNQKPLNSLQPQTLEKLVRHGFTMVEWGGLKTP